MSCQSRFNARYWMLGAGALGPSERMEAVKTTFAPYGIRESVRTGKVLMIRGDETTTGF